jgi:hypothetical protein
LTLKFLTKKEEPTIMTFLKDVEQVLSNFAQREVKFEEAKAFTTAANAIVKYGPAWAGVATSATTVEAFIALVEKDDAQLGPIVSGEINLVLNNNTAEISAGVATLVGQGMTFLNALAQTLLAMASKLQSEALALA